MKIQKRHYLILSLVILFLLSVEVCNYIGVLRQIGQASAVTVGTPNPGHTWAQMECNANTLCLDTTNGYVGVGTNTPAYKLDVNGTMNLNSNRIQNVATPTVSTDAAPRPMWMQRGDPPMLRAMSWGTLQRA